jgi:hypothetical protein
MIFSDEAGSGWRGETGVMVSYIWPFAATGERAGATTITTVPAWKIKAVAQPPA